MARARLGRRVRPGCRVRFVLPVERPPRDLRGLRPSDHMQRPVSIVDVVKRDERPGGVNRMLVAVPEVRERLRPGSLGTLVEDVGVPHTPEVVPGGSVDAVPVDSHVPDAIASHTLPPSRVPDPGSNTLDVSARADAFVPEVRYPVQTPNSPRSSWWSAVTTTVSASRVRRRIPTSSGTT